MQEAQVKQEREPWMADTSKGWTRKIDQLVQLFKKADKKKKHIKSVLQAAVLATTSMSIYMRIVGGLQKKELKIINILGTLLTGRKKQTEPVAHSPEALAAGAEMHLSIGLFFTFCYHLLWENNITKPDIKSGLMLGLLNGFIGIGGWKFLFAVGRHRPVTDLRSYLFHIFLAHGIFGMVEAGVYGKNETHYIY